MPSTYSNLKIQLMATGENNTTWGDVTNLNLGTALEEAIVGSADVAFSNANVTLTLTDTNASQTARNMRLNLTGTATAGYNLVVPAIEKPYIINNGTDGTITVKNSTGTGIAVPAGKTMWVYNDGTNVVDAVTRLSSLTLGTALVVGSGGTGANTFTSNGVLLGNGTSAISATAAGTTGQVLVGNTGSAPTWATLSTSAVTSFSAGTTGFTPNTATTGAITLAGTLGVTNGGTGTSTQFTAGSVVFAGASGVYSQSNANLFWDNSNNRLGIGTSSPGTRLHVQDTETTVRLTATSGRIWDLVSGGGGNVGANFFAIRDTSSGANVVQIAPQASEAMRIDASGNVGIGTTNPLTKLHLLTPSATAVALRAGNSVSYAEFQVDTSGNSQLIAPGGTQIFNTNGAERMRIDSSGNVGIGTSSPSYLLHLNQNGNTQAWISATNAGSNSAGIGFENQGQRNWQIWADRTNDALQFGNNSRATTNMVINSSGNVGIGTSLPGSKLTVVGGAVQQYRASGDNNAFYGSTSDTSNNYLRLGNTTGTLDLTCSNGSAYLNTTQNGPLWFGTNGTERVRITSSGDIGIGTSSPSNKLDVNGSVNIGAALLTGTGVSTGDAQIELGGNRTGNGNAYIDWHTTSGADYEMRIARYTGVNGGADILNTGTGNFSIGQQGSAPLLLLTSGSERARIDSSGSLLVGTTTTFGKLSVYGTTGFNADANAAIPGSGSHKFRGTASGTTITTYDYLNYTAVQFIRDNGNPTNTVGSITCTDGSTSYNTSSDRRLKKDIVPAGDAGSVIDAIEIVSHGWKASEGTVPFGVIAQDLHAVAPQAVHAGDTGEEVTDVWGVDYSKLVPMLVKEIQSLRARVAQLEGN